MQPCPSDGAYFLQSIAQAYFDKPTDFIYNSHTFLPTNGVQKVTPTLEELIKAKFTFIAIDTMDTHLVPEVLEAVLPNYSFVKFVLSDESKKEAKEDESAHAKPIVYYHLPDTEPSLARVKQLSMKQKTVLLINYRGSNPLVHHYGTLNTPETLIAKSLLKAFTAAEKNIVIRAVSGLSYSQSKQLIRLAEVKGIPKTYAAFNHLRSAVYGSSDGIYTVDVSESIYKPSPELNEWFTANKPFMFDETAGLSPRGVMLAGEGGTGKTEFSKYISHDLKVPLYRLDIGSSLSRWQGESEANIRACLKFVDENAPCILLIDEVEKALPKSNSEESSSRILGHLLWWLAEHTSPVFSVMTTNDLSALPKELYRDGRCDAVFTLTAITSNADKVLIASAWFDNWAANNKVPAKLIKEVSETTYGYLEGKAMTPAAITNLCRVELRKGLAAHKKG